MKYFNRILVGIDFSPASARALKQAQRIASADDAELTALHVIVASEVEDFTRNYTVPADSIQDSFESEISDFVERETGSPDTAASEAIFGIPYHELTYWAETHDSDLLVIGSQGSGKQPHGVGYFASKCARHAKIPVLLTRRKHEGVFRSVVACVDFSESTQEVLEIAASIAVDEAAPLHVVHAVRPPWMRTTHVLYNSQTFEDDAYKAQFRELLNDQMESACRELPVKAVTHVVEHNSPAQALIHFLQENDSDLAVVGRSGKTGKLIKAFLLGSTAERLIHHSPCSLRVVPPKKSS